MKKFIPILLTATMLMAGCTVKNGSVVDATTEVPVETTTVQGTVPNSDLPNYWYDDNNKNQQYQLEVVRYDNTNNIGHHWVFTRIIDSDNDYGYDITYIQSFFDESGAETGTKCYVRNSNEPSDSERYISPEEWISIVNQTATIFSKWQTYSTSLETPTEGTIDTIGFWDPKNNIPETGLFYAYNNDELFNYLSSIPMVEIDV